MILKIDAKCEEKLICWFKNDKNLVKFDPSTQKSPKLALSFARMCKIFNVWPKKVQRSYLSWHWRVMQNLKKNWLVVWKMIWGIWQIFTRALESLKIWTLMRSFNPKYKKYELQNSDFDEILHPNYKKYELKIHRGVMYYSNEEWCKIWRGTDLLFQNWHEESNEFWLKHLKI